jgi:hypothetical protein
MDEGLPDQKSDYVQRPDSVDSSIPDSAVSSTASPPLLHGKLASYAKHGIISHSAGAAAVLAELDQLLSSFTSTDL